MYAARLSTIRCISVSVVMLHPELSTVRIPSSRGTVYLDEGRGAYESVDRRDDVHVCVCVCQIVVLYLSQAVVLHI